MTFYWTFRLNNKHLLISITLLFEEQSQFLYLILFFSDIFDDGGIRPNPLGRGFYNKLHMNKCLDKSMLRFSESRTRL